MAEYFATRKFNVHGRYMSILSLKAMDRAVIILPEAFNAGWRDIAAKMGNFITESSVALLKASYRNVDINYPYAKVVGDSKWQPHNYKMAKINLADGTKPSTSNHDKGILGRCIIGTFDSEMPTLFDVRKWASSTWKKAFGTNIYEMLGNTFLFEFPNKNMATQVLQGVWIWKKSRVKLEW